MIAYVVWLIITLHVTSQLVRRQQATFKWQQRFHSEGKTFTQNELVIRDLDQRSEVVRFHIANGENN